MVFHFKEIVSQKSCKQKITALLCLFLGSVFIRVCSSFVFRELKIVSNILSFYFHEQAMCFVSFSEDLTISLNFLNLHIRLFFYILFTRWTWNRKEVTSTIFSKHQISGRRIWKKPYFHFRTKTIFLELEFFSLFSCCLFLVIFAFFK